MRVAVSTYATSIVKLNERAMACQSLGGEVVGSVAGGYGMYNAEWEDSVM